jgi:hypothetical protein
MDLSIFQSGQNQSQFLGKISKQVLTEKQGLSSENDNNLEKT